jgi:hypothetical protein
MSGNAATAPISAHRVWLWPCAVGRHASEAWFAFAAAVGKGTHATSWWPLGGERHTVEGGYGSSRVRSGRLARISDASCYRIGPSPNASERIARADGT